MILGGPGHGEPLCWEIGVSNRPRGPFFLPSMCRKRPQVHGNQPWLSLPVLSRPLQKGTDRSCDLSQLPQVPSAFSQEHSRVAARPKDTRCRSHRGGGMAVRTKSDLLESMHSAALGRADRSCGISLALRAFVRRSGAHAAWAGRAVHNSKGSSASRASTNRFCSSPSIRDRQNLASAAAARGRESPPQHVRHAGCNEQAQHGNLAVRSPGDACDARIACHAFDGTPSSVCRVRSCDLARAH